MALAVAGCGSSSRPTANAGPFLPLAPVFPSRRALRVDRAARHEQAVLLRLARRGGPVFCAGHHGRRVALTFDDGPGPGTPRLLRILRRARARATFFLIGRRVALYPAKAQRERLREVVGDHTMTHADLDDLPPRAVLREVRGGRRAVPGAVRLFRPPYGARGRVVDRVARRLGLVQILWDVDSGDSDAARVHAPREIAGHVVHATRPGSIVLLHENRPQTLDALPAILRGLRRRHLRPVTVPALLAAQPPGPRCHR